MFNRQVFKPICSVLVHCPSLGHRRSYSEMSYFWPTIPAEPKDNRYSIKKLHETVEEKLRHAVVEPIAKIISPLNKAVLKVEFILDPNKREFFRLSNAEARKKILIELEMINKFYTDILASQQLPDMLQAVGMCQQKAGTYVMGVKSKVKALSFTYSANINNNINEKVISTLTDYLKLVERSLQKIDKVKNGAEQFSLVFKEEACQLRNTYIMLTDLQDMQQNAKILHDILSMLKKMHNALRASQNVVADTVDTFFSDIDKAFIPEDSKKSLNGVLRFSPKNVSYSLKPAYLV